MVNSKLSPKVLGIVVIAVAIITGLILVNRGEPDAVDVSADRTSTSATHSGSTTDGKAEPTSTSTDPASTESTDNAGEHTEVPSTTVKPNGASADSTPESRPTNVSCPPHVTLTEQVSELLMVGVDPTRPAAARRMLAQHPTLAGIFIGGNSDAILTDQSFTRMVKSGTWLVAVDEEGGRVQRVDNIGGAIPSPAKQSLLGRDKIRELAQARGALMHSLGININFAPVVDLSAPATDLVIGDRSYSTDPEAVITFAGAFSEGIRSARVATTLKHFPGHGRAVGDSHTRQVTAPDISSLREKDLIPYKQLIGDPLTTVMVGHLDVPGLTEPGRPSSVSPATYRLLRDEIGYSGVVFTDELGGMKAVSSRFAGTRAVVEAIKAGADVALLATYDPEPSIEALEKAVSSGEIPRAQVDTSVQRVLALKKALGLSVCR